MCYNINVSTYVTDSKRNLAIFFYSIILKMFLFFQKSVDSMYMMCYNIIKVLIKP